LEEHVKDLRVKKPSLVARVPEHLPDVVAAGTAEVLVRDRHVELHVVTDEVGVAVSQQEVGEAVGVDDDVEAAVAGGRQGEIGRNALVPDEGGLGVEGERGFSGRAEPLAVPELVLQGLAGARAG
jgi:hypothetical protein